MRLFLLAIACLALAARAETEAEIDALIKKGDYQAAEAQARRLAAAADAAGDLRSAGAARLLQSSAAYDLGRLGDYSRLSREALALYRRADDTAGIARSLYFIAYESYATAPAKMLDGLREAMPTIERSGDRKLLMEVENAIGMGYWVVGPFSAAIEHFTRAGAIARERGDRRNAAIATANAATLIDHRGEHDRAIPLFQGAIAIFRELDAKPILAQQLGNLGESYAAAGETERALKLFEEALQVQHQTGFKHSEANLLGNVAHVYWDLGEDSRALRATEQALAIDRETGDRRLELALLLDTADQLVSRGQMEEAARLVDQAAAPAASLGDRSVRIWLLLASARSRPDSAAALPQATAAREEALRLGDHVLSARAEAVRAELLERAGRGPEAIKAWAAAIADRSRGLQDVHLWHARLARLELEAGDAESARRDYETSLRLIDQLDERMALDRFRIRLFEETSAVYRSYASWLAHRGEPLAAWAVAERGRARALSRKVLGGAPAEEPTEAEREALALLSGLQVELDDRALGSPRRAELLRRIDDAELALDRARLAAAQAPARAQLPRFSLPPSPAVEYLIADDELIVFSNTAGRASVRFVPGAAALLERARRFAERVADAQTPFAFTAEDRGLAVDLLGAEPLPGRLAIVPDGELHRFPFAALPDAQGAFLARSLAISLSPSLVAPPRQRPPIGALEAAAIASGAGVPALGLPPLAEADDEARMVASHARGARLLLDATEAAVKALDLPRLDLLHFATHSVVNDGRPDRSAVVLRPDLHEDGLLQAREIYRLRLGARLVVLSSCQSGSGALVGGEGMLGLVHAMLSAGAGAVVASLWRVQDRAAARFMSRFYDRAGEVPLAEALRLAQADPAEHPATWAGYVVFGDAEQRLPLAAPVSRLPWVAAAAIAALLAGFAGWRRFRR